MGSETDGQMDKEDEGNSRLSRFCESALKVVQRDVGIFLLNPLQERVEMMIRGHSTRD